MALKMHPSLSVHPGDWLKTEIIDAHGLKLGEAAEHLGVTRQALSRLVNGHYGLSADMAIRVEKVFGVRADTLMRMQVAHDLAAARAHEDELEVKLRPDRAHARPISFASSRGSTPACS